MKTTSLSRLSVPSRQSVAAFVRYRVCQSRATACGLAATLMALLTPATPLQAQDPAYPSTPLAEGMAKSIPFNQLGAEAQKQYAGDGVGITPTTGGARLRATFQDLAAEATPDGLWLESIADEDAGKPAGFRVRAMAVGSEGGTSFDLAERGQVRATGGAALYLRAGLIEECTVSMDGTRPDFVLPQRPAGTRELHVDLAVDGARAEASPYGAKLTLDGSGRVIAYSSLHVADANGRELTAKLEVTDTNRIQLRVNDSNATYPIRIDPTFSDADWINLNPGIPRLNRSIGAVVVYGGGNLYIGGDFPLAGTVAANRMAKRNGSTWSALGSGMNDWVSALAADATGHLFVGGDFTTAGTTASPFIVQANVATTLEIWRLTWHDTTLNTVDAADLADPHHTGIPNLMVYAFPGPDQSPALASLGQMSAALIGCGNYFIRFTRPTGVSGVSYGAQWSPHLAEGSWQALADTGSGTQHLFSLPMAGQPRAFMRLTVSDP